jgi:hypothetical protein
MHEPLVQPFRQVMGDFLIIIKPLHLEEESVDADRSSSSNQNSKESPIGFACLIASNAALLLQPIEETDD